MLRRHSTKHVHYHAEICLCRSVQVANRPYYVSDGCMGQLRVRNKVRLQPPSWRERVEGAEGADCWNRPRRSSPAQGIPSIGCYPAPPPLEWPRVLETLLPWALRLSSQKSPAGIADGGGGEAADQVVAPPPRAAVTLVSDNITSAPSRFFRANAIFTAASIVRIHVGFVE